MNWRRLLLATLFAVAMGFLEAAVVVYLRLLYYPQGFELPLVALPNLVMAIEIGRELATMVMLVTVACLTGRTGWERFGWLCFLFGVWDVSFYAGLKLTLDWPASLFTWDILFLIPVTWMGPVLAPLVTSLALIAGGLTIVHYEARGVRIQVLPLDWMLVLLSLGLQLTAYTTSYSTPAPAGPPASFQWPLFLAGVLLGVGTLIKCVILNPRAPVE